MASIHEFKANLNPHKLTKAQAILMTNNKTQEIAIHLLKERISKLETTVQDLEKTTLQDLEKMELKYSEIILAIRKKNSQDLEKMELEHSETILVMREEFLNNKS